MATLNLARLSPLAIHMPITQLDFVALASTYLVIEAWPARQNATTFTQIQASRRPAQRALIPTANISEAEV
jgi:hypothetical protein